MDERKSQELVRELDDMLAKGFEEEMEARYRAAKTRFEAMTHPDLPLLTDR